MTPEEITMIRTALRFLGENMLSDAKSRKYAGPRFRQVRQQFRNDARPWFKLADQPDEYFRSGS